jgi:branched-subunit amino acid aminotransferase/4-amino-4-deoxychorismate lyase
VSEAFLNGKFVPSEAALVPITDRGFLFGDGIYETLLATQGRIRTPELHLARLRKSASILNIPLPYSDEDWNQILFQLLTRNGWARAILRITISAGPSQGLGRGRQVTSPTVAVTCDPAPEYSEQDYQRGISVVVAQTVRHPGAQPWVEAKTANRLVFILAAQEAARRGADDALLADAASQLVEGTRGNIFVVRDGKLKTPPLRSGCLDGVTRRLIAQTAQQLGFAVEETPLTLENLLQASEVFQTFTSAGVMPVTRVDGLPILHGAAGKTTLQLLEQYRKLYGL